MNGGRLTLVGISLSSFKSLLYCLICECVAKSILYPCMNLLYHTVSIKIRHLYLCCYCIHCHCVRHLYDQLRFVTHIHERVILKWKNENMQFQKIITLCT